MFHPHTDKDRRDMLNVIGLEKLEDLFSDVPDRFRFPDLNLPKQHSEMEALSELEKLAGSNTTVKQYSSFLGAGAYNHYIPAAVDAILRRGEFYTAYTPYQPEISQGTLQSIFEYQSHIVNLTGMDVSNASHYDGATAASEAINMARTLFRGSREKGVVSPGVHPHYRDTIDTYLRGTEFKIEGSDLDPASGPDSLIDLIDEKTAIVLVQYPDFFGRVFDYQKLADAAHQVGALLAVSINPIALGMLKPPGEFDADIVTGEGQPLGIPLSYGGPYLGILATKDEYVRALAGRLVGETVDSEGKRGYVLTLSTREQHIRRERASSNICTNQGLMMLAAAVYVSLLGKHGIQEVAELCYQKAHYAAQEIAKIPGFELWGQEIFFNEFVIKCPISPQEINHRLLQKNIFGGYSLGQDYSQLDQHMMIAVTEMNSKEEIDTFVSALEDVANG